MVQTKEVESRVCDHPAHMACAVGIAQRGLQHDAVAGVGLDREGKKPLRREHVGGRGRHWSEIADIHENVGCEDEVI